MTIFSVLSYTDAFPWERWRLCLMVVHCMGGGCGCGLIFTLYDGLCRFILLNFYLFMALSMYDWNPKKYWRVELIFRNFSQGKCCAFCQIFKNPPCCCRLFFRFLVNFILSILNVANEIDIAIKTRIIHFFYALKYMFDWVLTCYTDGLKKEGRSGAGVFCHELSMSLSYRLGLHARFFKLKYSPFCVSVPYQVLKTCRAKLCI